MVAVGDPAQRRHRLPLGAGHDVDDLFVRKLRHLARLDQRIIELEVDRVDDETGRGGDAEADGVRDAVADAERFHGKGARGENRMRVGVELPQVGPTKEARLLELDGDQPEGQLRGVDGDREEVGEEIRQGADAVLVDVGDEDRADAVLVLPQVRDVR